MNAEAIKNLFKQVHDTTKEHTENKRSYITWMIARLVALVFILRDNRLAEILKSMFAR